MPRILLPDGSTTFKPVLDPTDILADGQKTAVQQANAAAGQDPTQVTTAQVLNPGSDDNALMPVTALPVLRRTTAPRFGAPVTRSRNTTKPIY